MYFTFLSIHEWLFWLNIECIASYSRIYIHLHIQYFLILNSPEPHFQSFHYCIRKSEHFADPRALFLESIFQHWHHIQDSTISSSIWNTSARQCSIFCQFHQKIGNRKIFIIPTYTVLCCMKNICPPLFHFWSISAKNP